ncbi:MAG TPA: hypothetical protein VMK16_18080 [Acidimicrobiales bacterium]|nr:hypothetical protein [Acidimicrobiales bacterium]
MTLREFAEQEFRGLEIVSVSEPEPILLDRNVMAVTDDVEMARAAVVALEDLEPDGARLGLVVLGAGHLWGPEWHEGASGNAAPEGATSPAARAPMGAVTGAIIGALVVGILAALLGNGDTGMVGMIVGAVAGAVIGAMVAAFSAMGGSDAYRSTSVSPIDKHLCLVSLHTNDRDEAKAARKRLAGRPWADVFDVDARGKTRHR